MFKTQIGLDTVAAKNFADAVHNAVNRAGHLNKGRTRVEDCCGVVLKINAGVTGGIAAIPVVYDPVAKEEIRV